MIIHLFLLLKELNYTAPNGYVPNYANQPENRVIGKKDISYSCFINICLMTTGDGGAVFYNGKDPFNVLDCGFFFCYVVDGSGGAVYAFVQNIQFTYSCAYNCKAEKINDKTGVGQFACLTGKKPGLVVGFHKSTIFGCPGGGVKSFQSANHKYSSPVYFANDPSINATSESYSSLQYDHSNATHSYINDGTGSVLLRNSLVPHIQYCYITDNEMVSEDPRHGFIDISQCNCALINNVILKNNVGKGNSLIVLDEIHKGNQYQDSDFQYLYLENNTYEYFILLLSGDQVRLDNVFFQGSEPNIKVSELGSNQNSIIYQKSFSRSKMAIQYESFDLDCDKVYFAFTDSKTLSPSRSHLPTISRSPLPTISRFPLPTLSRSPLPTISKSPFPTPSIPPQTGHPTQSIPPTQSPEPTLSKSPCPSLSMSPLPTPSQSPLPTMPRSPEPTPSKSPYPSLSILPLPTPSHSLEPTKSLTAPLDISSITTILPTMLIPTNSFTHALVSIGDQANSGSLKSWEISLIILAPILLGLIALLFWYLYRRGKLTEKRSDMSFSMNGEATNVSCSNISQENPLFKAGQDFEDPFFDDDDD
jgi:hypothetical protein